MKYLESFFLLNGTGTVPVQDQKLCFQMIIDEMLISTRIFTARNTFPVHLLILLYKVKIDIYNRYDLHDLHRSQQISVFATDVPGSKLILLDYGCSAVQRQTTVTVCFELQDSLQPTSTGMLTAVQIQTAVTAYFTSKQLLLFVFELQDSLLPSSTDILTTEQRQTAVTAHLYSKHKQLLLFIFELQDSLLTSSTGILTAVQRQTTVTAHLYSKRKQLLLFIFELQDSLLPSSTGILTAVQRQTAVTAYLKFKSY